MYSYKNELTFWICTVIFRDSCAERPTRLQVWFLPCQLIIWNVLVLNIEPYIAPGGLVSLTWQICRHQCVKVCAWVNSTWLESTLGLDLAKKKNALHILTITWVMLWLSIEVQWIMDEPWSIQDTLKYFFVLLLIDDSKISFYLVYTFTLLWKWIQPNL